MKKRSSHARGRKAKKAAKTKAQRLRGRKRPKISQSKATPRAIKEKVIKYGEAVEYIGGEKTLRKGRHKILESGPLTIGKPGIAVLKAMVDALEKLSPKTKLSYTLEVRYNDRSGERKSVVSENIAIPILQNIELTKKNKKDGVTKKEKWLSIVYAILRKKVFAPLYEEFNFISGNRVPTKRRVKGKMVRVRDRAQVIRTIERFRKSQNTRFKLTLQREVF